MHNCEYNEIGKRLKEKLTEIYSWRASDNRINWLTEHLLRVIEDTNEKLDEILYFVDEFEGGVSENETFESIVVFVLGILSVNKENAQRVFDFFKRCKNKIIFVALTGDFYAYLMEEQKSILS